MLEKIKSLFDKKDKKIENLVFLLILLIITLFVMNNILEDENIEEDRNTLVGAKLAEIDESTPLETRLENILSQISGVGKVSVLLTYGDEELEGTIIVSEGAEKAMVKTNIITAVEAVTGLGKHKIQVYSMND